MECNFCKAILSDKYTLATHQKKVKKCLRIQGKFLDDVPKRKKEYFCICDVVTISKKRLQVHQATCLMYQLDLKDKYYNKIISEKDQKIKELEDKLFEIANKPTTTNNNTTNTLINNILPMDERFQQDLSDYIYNNLTLDYLIKGQKGVAELVYEFIKDDEYIVISDRTRNVCKYRNKEGVIVRDPNGKFLANICHVPAVKKSENIITEVKELVKLEKEISNTIKQNKDISDWIQRQEAFLKGISSIDLRRKHIEDDISNKKKEYERNQRIIADNNIKMGGRKVLKIEELISIDEGFDDIKKLSIDTFTFFKYLTMYIK